ncbi:hypothetical protein [Arcobacter sp. LA11]|uniref:hypothetical protein n=1 Tax=Arcobacter sp. LA11 TaxID=1898176 RepID=UPI0009F9AE9F|nr:hypothetical protein [Arcobacter sp. LA11]
MENKLTFHINNMAYTINVEESLKKEMTRYLPTDKNVDTKELLAAFIRISQEFTQFKEDLEIISDKIPKI